MSGFRHATPLELADFPVDELRFGGALRYAGRSLEVDEAEVVEIASRDPRILSARLDIVRPGEAVRVTGIRDSVEPRVKVDGGGQVFPGITNPVTPVGAGRTHRLSGMTLMTAAEYEGTVRTGTTAQRSAILDMWGPGAEMTGFSRLPHLVLTVGLPPDLIEAEAHQAIQAAEYRVAQRLAEATVNAEPAGVETHGAAHGNASLPKAVVIVGCITESEHLPTGLGYYGLPVRESLATVVHPNEMLDGAVTGNTLKTIAYYPTTWDWQNHPLALRLSRRTRSAGSTSPALSCNAYASRVSSEKGGGGTERGAGSPCAGSGGGAHHLARLRQRLPGGDADRASLRAPGRSRRSWSPTSTAAGTARTPRSSSTTTPPTRW